jgi:transcriptional pleiotropic repressor
MQEMEKVLEKTRALGTMIQRTKGIAVNFEELAQVLSDKIGANCYILSSKGKLLGYCWTPDFVCVNINDIIQESERFPKSYNAGLLRTTESKANLSQQGNHCVFSRSEKCVYEDKISTIIPILGGAERVGTLVLAKFGEKFNSGDLIVAEYGATVVGMEILREKAEKAEVEARKKAAVQIAVGTLSYSELEAVEHIFAELDGIEGHLVASRIADNMGITRSVIVNALRKFESAGVVETKSLGMKGTYIHILNEFLLEELQKNARR